MNGKNFSQYEELVEEVSNMEGNDAVVVETIENYDPGQDDDISFDGNTKNPLGKVGQINTFKVKITNSGSATVDRTIALFPAFYDDTNKAKILDSTGTAIAAILKDGNVVGNNATDYLTASGSPRTIYELIEYLKRVPTRLIGIKMLVNTQDQFEQTFYTYDISPFRKTGEIFIDPSESKTSEQPNEYRAEIDLSEYNMSIGYMNPLVYKILAGKEVDLTFIFGAEYNIQKGLKKRAERATSGKPVVKKQIVQTKPVVRKTSKITQGRG